MITVPPFGIFGATMSVRYLSYILIAFDELNSKMMLNLIPSSFVGEVHSTICTEVSFFTVLPLIDSPTIVTFYSPLRRTPKMHFLALLTFSCAYDQKYCIFPCSSLISND